ncbi:MAG: Asp23/Gls24 family envelope stress response protein [Lachnospiraceae bacterium]|nr:Asp23/Gls24 family envelope stress response protein [Lachnospiraceae bacterium]
MAENQSTYTLKDNGENGTIKVAADVVSVIAGLAATEVKGVSSLNGGITNAMVARRGNKALSKGVRITVEDGVVKVDLGVNLAYGFSIPEVCTTIQEKVKASIETMTGMQVADVNIHVADIAAEEDV